MQKRDSIVRVPLLIGIALSVTIHVAALYSRGRYRPPEVHMDSGRTVVQLTLMPAAAHKDAVPQVDQTKPAESVEPEIPVPVVAVPRPTPSPHPAPDVQPEPPAAPEVKSTEPTASKEQVASLQKDKGVTTKATVTGSFRPAYPRISQRRGETGTVRLSVQVKTDGATGEISLLQSSGHRRLDNAAIAAAKKTRFNPARKFGKTVVSTTELEFTFKLTDD